MTAASPTPGEPADLAVLAAVAHREHRAGRLAEAAAAYRMILELRPDSAETHHSLGDIFQMQGQLDDAAGQYEQALSLRPDLFPSYSGLARILCEQGKFEQARARLQQLIALNPNYPAAHNNLGNIFQMQGQLDEAAAQYEQALALKPDYAEAHNNLGNVLEKRGRLDEAAARYRQAVALRPDFFQAHDNLGDVFRQQGLLEQAIGCYQRAIALRPDLAETHNHLGNILRKQGKLDLATAHFDRALALRPDYAEAHINLGHVLRGQNQLEEATARYQQALTFRPDSVEAQMGLAACHLLLEDYERGWPAYEWRLRMGGLPPPPDVPRWSGEPLAGRRILLLTEQGLGDTFQFIRYVRLLKEQGARVVLNAQRALGPLLASQPDFVELFILGSAPELPRCDFYLPLLSLPGAFGTTAATIPCDVPYLAADPKLTGAWRREMLGIDGIKIGIAWQGAPGFRLDRWRSIPLAHFAPLALLPGVRLVSLQKGFGSEQVATVDFPVLDLSGRLDEVAGAFMDTAALIQSLDLVVTPDSAIAHLAGALGAPVWVALPFSANWRWLRRRDDSPWYPTMRLFRQTKIDDWPDVFFRITQAVQAARSETA